jgi:hypothetical protein
VGCCSRSWRPCSAVRAHASLRNRNPGVRWWRVFCPGLSAGQAQDARPRTSLAADCRLRIAPPARWASPVRERIIEDCAPRNPDPVRGSRCSPIMAAPPAIGAWPSPIRAAPIAIWACPADSWFQLATRRPCTTGLRPARATATPDFYDPRRGLGLKRTEVRSGRNSVRRNRGSEREHPGQRHSKHPHLVLLWQMGSYTSAYNGRPPLFVQPARA